MDPIKQTVLGKIDIDNTGWAKVRLLAAMVVLVVVVVRGGGGVVMVRMAMIMISRRLRL